MLVLPIIVLTVLGFSNAYTITDGKVVANTGGYNLGNCLVCNTAVTLPQPKCGIDSTTLVAMTQKAELLKKSLNAIYASGCCGTSTSSGTSGSSGSGGSGGYAWSNSWSWSSSGSSNTSSPTTTTTKPVSALSSPTKQHVGYSTAYRIYGRYDTSQQWTFVDMRNNTRVKYSDAQVVALEVFIDNVASCDIKIGIFRPRAGSQSPCDLVQVRSLIIPASRINAKNSSATIELTAAERNSMNLLQGDYLGFSYVNGGCIRYEYIKKDSPVSERPQNYCQGVGTPQDNTQLSLAFEVDRNRGNRQYSAKIYYDHVKN